ncbi:YT521-B-like domain-containing protein [Lipomyces oligophaga]|uniref:YT521-B-like domain-containing protein n=1 Tax=Lipomyces oligophaga TaxID=45792 RepID=UPI0034CDA893
MSASAPSIPRGPPCKPKQSGHALWVGNLPPPMTVLNLRDMFASSEIESVFLISKSSCAFVNYTSDHAVRDALEKFKRTGGIFNGTKLVARLQRGSLAERSAAISPGTSELHEDLSELVTTSVEEGQAEGNEANSNSSLGVSGIRPHRSASYFIVKSLTVQDLELSVKTGVWTTQTHNEPVLNEAYKSSDVVYLIFSANKSGEYFGYARMAGPIDPQDAPSLDQYPVYEYLPKTTYTPASEIAPAGRIIDDSSRGTIFWEVVSESTGTDENSAADTGVSKIAGGSSREGGRGGVSGSESSKPWGTPFKVIWMSTNRVSFMRTRMLRNPWNDHREVKVARDGTELEPTVGEKVLELFESEKPLGTTLASSMNVTATRSDERGGEIEPASTPEPSMPLPGMVIVESPVVSNE